MTKECNCQDCAECDKKNGGIWSAEQDKAESDKIAAAKEKERIEEEAMQEISLENKLKTDTDEYPSDKLFRELNRYKRMKENLEAEIACLKNKKTQRAMWMFSNLRAFTRFINELTVQHKIQFDLDDKNNLQ